MTDLNCYKKYFDISNQHIRMTLTTGITAAENLYFMNINSDASLSKYEFFYFINFFFTVASHQ